MRKAQDRSLIGKYTDTQLSAYARKSAYNDAGGVVFVGEPARSEVVQFAIETLFKSESVFAKIMFAKFIAYRNKNVDDFNDIVRAALGRKDIMRKLAR